MINSVINNIEKYNPKTKNEYENAFKETIQELVLYALSKTDFFTFGAFYGGTALRIFYNLERYSEDLDFSLLVKNDEFKIEKYFDEIEKVLSKYGLKFDINIKNKNNETHIQSAFLKGNTLQNLITIKTPQELINKTQHNELIKIKFEIDIDPPKNAEYEYKYNNFPVAHKVKIFNEASLFAGKVHAILCRSWAQRVKGRDYYDFAFYIKRKSVISLKHLQKRIEQTNNNIFEKDLDISLLKEMLRSKFNTLSFSEIKKDIVPFIKDTEELEIWDYDYFMYLLDNIYSNEIEFTECNSKEKHKQSKFYVGSYNEYIKKITLIKEKLHKFIIKDENTNSYCFINFNNQKTYFELNEEVIKQIHAVLK